jgi:hypothetical protein
MMLYLSPQVFTFASLKNRFIMINLILKIAATLGLLVFSSLNFADGKIGNGIFFFFMSLIVAFFIWRHERLLMAFWQIRKNNMTKAAVHLDKITKPELLLKRQRAYFYFLKGLTLSQDRGVYEAEKYFKKALNTGLRMSHDRAMAKLSLATAAMARRRKKEAQVLLTEAKKEDKHNLLTDQIRMMKEQMKRI